MTSRPLESIPNTIIPRSGSRRSVQFVGNDFFYRHVLLSLLRRLVALIVTLTPQG
jgi:hypothetical protein